MAKPKQQFKQVKATATKPKASRKAKAQKPGEHPKKVKNSQKRLASEGSDDTVSLDPERPSA